MTNASENADDDAWRAFCDELSATAKFGMDFGLEAMREALAAEGHPERASAAVLVAGTNGKGGTAADIAGILRAHGRRVGLYTSPHLVDLRERFRIDGRPVDRDRALRLGRPILDTYGGAEPTLTYFELTTLMATCLFEEAEVDVAVYEIGLGGRLDAVNAIDPAVSVITCIDRDHTQYLGEDLEDIAREKCGIARPDTPLIVGRQTHPSVLDVFPECAPEAELSIYGRDFDDTDIPSMLAEPTAPWTKRANAATARQTVRTLLAADYDDQRAARGLRSTRWPGRLDWRTVDTSFSGARDDVRTLFDVAHNPGAVDVLFDQLDEWPDAFAAVVCGGMADKDLEAMFAHLDAGPPVWGATLDADRAADPERLRRAIPTDRLVDVTDAESALTAAARRAAEEGGDLLVFGSTYLVGACFAAMDLDADQLTLFLD